MRRQHVRGLSDSREYAGTRAVGLDMAEETKSDPRRVLQSLGWTSENGTSGIGPAFFWTLYDEDGEETDGPIVVSGGTACGLGDFHDFSPAELRAFAQLAEESGS
jgi:hypothetical protein